MGKKSIVHDQNFPNDNAVSFGDRLAASDGFKALFKDGMALVEATAAYLDGEGRADAQRLPRVAALAYASESMRLTTQLMQIASWLLLQRAVNEGEMTQIEAAKDQRRTRIAWQTTASQTSSDELPDGLKDLTARSLRMQKRVAHLDALISDPRVEADVPRALELQMALLRDAFG